MKLFSKQKEEPTGSSIPRIAKMETPELLSWFNSQIMHLGNTFDEWRYHDSPESYVDESMEALSELWKEIKIRKNG
jgi:hypothetical protein